MSPPHPHPHDPSYPLESPEPVVTPRADVVFPPAPGRAWLTDLRLPPPGRHDHVIFLRGLPVAPWMQLRPWAEVWGVWLAHLEALFRTWQTGAGSGEERDWDANDRDAGDWEAWRALHIHSVETSRVEVGLSVLLPLLARIGRDVAERDLDQAEDGRTQGALHLIGHSVGGAVIVAYLAGLRARAHSAPALPLRAALTLDAAVSGLAGVWSGAKSYLHRVTGNHVMAEGLRGLNGWAAEQGIWLLTASNHGDLWSHKRLADVPYLGVRLGSRLALRDQIDGTNHDWLRRTPEFVQAIWGSVPTE